MDMRRNIDVSVSLAAMPLLAFAVAAAWIVTRKPPLFSQDRIGLNGKRFKLYKLRTMDDDISKPPQQRITRWGKMIRSIGLDEVPQLYSVLKGDMSLIGPRPMCDYENDVGYTRVGAEEWNYRYTIKPGLIPPSLIFEKLQGNGYKDPATRLRLDIEYINMRNCSNIIHQDMKLVWGAVAAVISRRVDPQAHVPTPSYEAKLPHLMS
jgi:lipopolysaccharide/colanic/teichoic acid biosynthesis glycosyltransferase